MITLSREHLQHNKSLLALTSIIFLTVTVYVAHWAALAQNATTSTGTSAVLEASKLVDRSHNLAIGPPSVLQSFFFLFAPLVVLTLAIQLNRDELKRTLFLIISLATISGIFGVLQLAGSADGALYFYRITNSGSAVGLFANRNHAAVFLACAFPLLAAVAAMMHADRPRGWNFWRLLTVAIAIVFAPLILVTGSRSGMIAGIIGLFGGALLYTCHVRTRLQPQNIKSFAPFLAAATILGPVFATIYFSRAAALDRFFAEPNDANDRADFWISSVQMFWQYFPFGFGPGSFVPAFQVEEPLELLSGEYLNRLHNDWLEIVLTFGVPGIVLTLIGAVFYFHRSFMLWMRMDGTRTGVLLGRMASIIILILATASVSDYPLRTPAMAGFAALVLVWFAHARRKPVPH